jgi:hypothetical protein
MPHYLQCKRKPHWDKQYDDLTCDQAAEGRIFGKNPPIKRGE